MTRPCSRCGAILAGIEEDASFDFPAVPHEYDPLCYPCAADLGFEPSDEPTEDDE